MSDETLTAGQRRTAKAREVFAQRFASPEEKSRYFAQLSERAAAQRRGGIVLSADEAAAVGEAFKLLAKVAQRVRGGAQE